MIRIRARRIAEKDLLAFCNELAHELGGGKDGLEFGIDKDENGKEVLWLFGKKLKTEENV